jgi:hypothetical protein
MKKIIGGFATALLFGVVLYPMAEDPQMGPG